MEGITQKELDGGVGRELRRGPEATIDLVETGDKSLDRLIDHGHVEPGGGLRRSGGQCLFEGQGKLVSRLIYGFSARFECNGDLGADGFEARVSVTIVAGPVGSRHEWFSVRGEEHTHGPPAATGEQLGCGHVDFVDIRPLFAVDFDTDELFVEDLGDPLVFKGLVGHYMAPVAR